MSKLRRSIKRRARALLRGSLSAGALLALWWVLARGAVSFLDSALFRLMGYRMEWFGGAEVPGDLGYLTRSGAVWASAALWGLRFLLLSPLWTGALGWAHSLEHGGESPFRALFAPYRRGGWLRACGVRLAGGAVFWGTALSLPGAVGAALYLIREKLGSLSTPQIALLSAVGGVAGAAWILLSRVLSLRYAMAPLLVGPGYGYGARKALALSVEYTRGHCLRLLWLDLSFLPWFLSCVLLAPALYVLPYYALCRAQYVKFLYDRQPRPVS